MMVYATSHTWGETLNVGTIGEHGTQVGYLLGLIVIGNDWRVVVDQHVIVVIIGHDCRGGNI